MQVWQHRLTPLQKIIGDGCHLDRNMKKLVKNQFEVLKLEEFYMEETPKIAGYMYKGVATKV